MLEKYLIEHCSPTLASIKTANLFSISADTFDLMGNLSRWNDRLKRKGVSMEILFSGERRVLIYVYREDMLKRDLNTKCVREFMIECGYQEKSVKGYIDHLKTRLGETDKFPHEIGLFLGYPLGDVIGFIENRGKNSKFGGYWKVYCNEQETKKLFANFNKCRDVYKQLFDQGKTVWQLTVAV